MELPQCVLGDPLGLPGGGVKALLPGRGRASGLIGIARVRMPTQPPHMGSQGLLLCIKIWKAITANCDIYIYERRIYWRKHDVHNVILDFWSLDFGNLRNFVFLSFFLNSIGVLLGFDMLDSLAFLFCFVRFWSYSNNATFKKKQVAFTLVLRGSNMCCWAQALFYYDLHLCKIMKNTKMKKQS